MTKKQIMTILEKEGLNVAEDAAVAVTAAALKLLRVVVPQLSTGAGIMIGLFLDAYESKIFELLDGIDGKDDPAY